MGTIFNNKELNIKRKSIQINPETAEHLLWKRLKSRQMKGYKFRRQFSVGNYILTIYSPELRLAIEIDGDCQFNDDELSNDPERTQAIIAMNINILSFTDTEIINDMDSVIDTIENEIFEAEKTRNKKTPH